MEKTVPKYVTFVRKENKEYDYETKTNYTVEKCFISYIDSKGLRAESAMKNWIGSSLKTETILNPILKNPKIADTRQSSGRFSSGNVYVGIHLQGTEGEPIFEIPLDDFINFGVGKGKKIEDGCLYGEYMYSPQDKTIYPASDVKIFDNEQWAKNEEIQIIYPEFGSEFKIKNVSYTMITFVGLDYFDLADMEAERLKQHIDSLLSGNRNYRNDYGRVYCNFDAKNRMLVWNKGSGCYELLPVKKVSVSKKMSGKIPNIVQISHFAQYALQEMKAWTRKVRFKNCILPEAGKVFRLTVYNDFRDAQKHTLSVMDCTDVPVNRFFDQNNMPNQFSRVYNDFVWKAKYPQNIGGYQAEGCLSGIIYFEKEEDVINLRNYQMSRMSYLDSNKKDASWLNDNFLKYFKDQFEGTEEIKDKIVHQIQWSIISYTHGSDFDMSTLKKVDNSINKEFVEIVKKRIGI